MGSALTVCLIQAVYLIYQFMIKKISPSQYSQQQSTLALIWGLIFLAQVTVFVRAVFVRFRHSGQVCSGDWDYYLYEGRSRDDYARTYDPFYLKHDGEMLRWYVMFFTWVWGVGGYCFGCIFGCILL